MGSNVELNKFMKEQKSREDKMVNVLAGLCCVLVLAGGQISPEDEVVIKKGETTIRNESVQKNTEVVVTVDYLKLVIGIIRSSNMKVSHKTSSRCSSWTDLPGPTFS